MTLNKEHHHDKHRPVLLESTITNLDPKDGERYLDLTAGYGGHASAISERAKLESVVLVDRDENAIAILKELGLPGTTVIKSDFLSATRRLREEKQRFDMILADLGVSSPQLDIAERGFSFQADGPLDMRMDQEGTLEHAADLVNTASQDELSSIIKMYGEEPHAKRIARAIVEGRPFSRTSALAEAVSSATPRKPSGRNKTHPATRTFQAIRIVVNDELNQLRETLPLLPHLLNDGGRLAVISFHSLEDRIVKQFFKEQSRYKYESTLELLTKRPLDGATEDSFHPRSRSAKLRVAVKIKTK